MIKTEMLRAFAEVARAGSLRDGADALGRTSSAVSMTLKNLEDHLGQPLFETERKNRLTPLGAFVLEMADRELQHFARTVKAVEDFAGAASGDVRIAAVPSYAATELPAVASAFLRDHSKVRLDIHDLDSVSILRELERERIDLGIVSDARDSPELERISLGSDAFGLVIRADDPLSSLDRVSWNDVAGTPFITNPLCERIDATKLQAAIATAKLRVHNTTTLIGMVRAGLGVTVLPELVTKNAAPGLIFRRLEEPVVWRELHLLLRLRDTPSPATAAFAKFVAAWPGRMG
jgi:DNA-binding transcriptional LysR family regulator